MDFTLEAAYPMLTIDGWPQSGELAAMKRAFADAAVRQCIRDDLARPSGTRIFNGHWERVEVTIARDEGLTGVTVAELAERRGADPLDAFLDLALVEDLRTVFTAKLLNVEEDRVAELLSMPGNLVSLSDAGAHHTLFCDAGFGIHFLSHWVRETGRFSLPEAIAKLTSEPARIYGLEGRGELTVGAAADFILFDPAELALSGTIKLKDLPAGGERLVRRAPGLKGTFVNGVRVHDGADYTGVEGPGQVLRRQTDPRTAAAAE
ncbi:MAG: amidohydrolase family protein [Minwuia sp.]|uniref:amidohydrolase family protein n=1 Tax=Minwuia sp. TaxID=2493630 RepID=UPI003A8A0AC3